jgi:hypothetical protein
MCSSDDMTCFLLKILLGKHEIWKLECYVSAENWPGNCAVEMLAWREDISISPLPPLFFLLFLSVFLRIKK